MRVATGLFQYAIYYVTVALHNSIAYKSAETWIIFDLELTLTEYHSFIRLFLATLDPIFTYARSPTVVQKFSNAKPSSSIDRIKMSTGPRTVKQIVKFTIAAGKAAPQPPVGPKLGQMGVNIMGFCKDFNAATAHYEEGTPLTVKVVAYTDRSASFTLRSPPVSYLLKRAAGVEKGATLKHVYEIAKIKQADRHIKHVPLESLCRSVIGTAGTCGIEVMRELPSPSWALAIVL
jgi:large subunit ribosomal protein L11